MLRRFPIIGLLFLLSCAEVYDNYDLKIFKYNESAGVNTLDPAYAKDQAIIWATSQLFNGLVQLDDSLNVKPSIAYDWQIDSSATLYTFFLRKDVYFHEHDAFKIKNGRKVVANDFVYSFGRLNDPKVASPGSWVMNNVKSVWSSNDTTLHIRLHNPFGPFLGLLSMNYCSVVPEEVIEHGNFRDEPIGTGPFVFQYWKENVKLVFRKNERYFEDGLPHLDAVAISFIKDKQTVFLEFLKGNIDFISGLDASYKDELLDYDGNLQEKYTTKVQMQSIPYLNTEYLGFLMEGNESPTKHLALRQAINLGFDRKKMIKFLRNDIGTPANKGFIPKGLPAYNERLKGFEYNPEKAKELLKSIDYSGQIIVLHTTSSYLDLCQFIQSELEKIGLNLNISVSPPSTHRQQVATSKFNFFRGSWIADYADAENYMALFYSKNFCPSGPNYTHYNNARFDALYEQANSETNLRKRLDLYRTMDQMIVDAAVVVPLYYDQVLRFVSNDIEDFDCNAMNMLNLKNVRKKQ